MMQIPNGPETDQGARHAKSLLRHISGRSPTLDDLCAVAIDSVGGLFCVISIADRSTQYVVGGCNVDFESFPRTYARYETVGEFFELSRMDENPVLSQHPLVDGRSSRARSVLLTGIFNQGILIGGVGLASDLPERTFSPQDRAIMARIARVAEGVIRSEVALSRMATEALSVLTDRH